MRKEAKTSELKGATLLKWRNRFSGEQGYVKTTSTKKGYFENTFDKNEAKRYRSDRELGADIAFLHSIGEDINNEFEIVHEVVSAKKVR